jgi:rare lipoprotein A
MRKWHVVLLIIVTALVDVAAATTRPRATFTERFFAAYPTKSHSAHARRHHALTRWAHRHHFRTQLATRTRNIRRAEATHLARVIHHVRAVRHVGALHHIADAILPDEGLRSSAAIQPDEEIHAAEAVRPGDAARPDADVAAPAEVAAAPNAAAPALRGLAAGGCAQIIKTSYYESGRWTASGEPFRPDGLTAAHRTLPFGTKLTVMNPRTGQSVTVVINDRGPYVRGVSLDLSRGAARAIGMRGTQHLCISEYE